MTQAVNLEDLKPVLSNVIHTNLQDTRRMALLLITYAEYVVRCNKVDEKPLDYSQWQDEAEKNKEFVDLVPLEQAVLDLQGVYKKDNFADYKAITMEALNTAILGTPSGKLRNKLTDYAIKLMTYED